ncbi:MAG: hypothetical protein ACE5FN_11715 [Leptospirillia bacterium]
MRKRYFIFVVALLLTGPVLATVPFAVGLDPYRVFGLSGYNDRNFAPNTRYLKTEYLLAHPEVDAFVLGSSRVNYYDVASLQQITGHAWYNLNVSAETAEGLLNRVRWLTANRKVRRLFIGLDYDFMFQVKRIRDDDYLRMEHPALRGTRLSFVWRQLQVPYREMVTAIEMIGVRDVEHYGLNLETGHYRRPARDDLMRRFPEEYARNLDTSVTPRRTAAHPWHLAAFDELVALLKERSVEAVFVINPVHATRIRHFKPDEYGDWLRHLATSGAEVWDFSGYNPVTTDNHLYYENSHFTRRVGDLVLGRALGALKPEMLPDGFGVRLTPEVVGERVRQLVVRYRPVT